MPDMPRGKARKGQIVALVDVGGRGRGPAAERLRQRMVDSFYRHPATSLTSALVRSLQQINEDLYAENENSIRAERTHATLACAVLRDGEVYFAIVGRALAFLVSEDGVERLGRGDPRPGDRPVDLLGQVEDAEIQLFHRPRSGSVALILATSGMADLAAGNLLAALPAEPDQVAPALARLCHGDPDVRPFRALVVAPDAEEDADEDEDPTFLEETRPIRPRPNAALGAQASRLRDFMARASQTPALAALPPYRPSAPRPANASATAPRAGATDRPRSAGGGREAGEPVTYPRAIPIGEAVWGAHRVGAPTISTATADDWPGRRPGFVQPVTGAALGDEGPEDEEEDWLDEEEAEAGPGPLATALATLRAVVERAAPAPADLERSGQERWRGARSYVESALVAFLRAPGEHTRLGLLAIAMFAIGYVLVQVPARVIQGGAAYTSAVADLAQARQREQQAMSEQDPLVRRHLLDTARQFAGQAQAEQPGDPGVAAALSRIQNEYATATNSATLGPPVQLVQPPTPGDQIVVNGLDLYVLDRANSRVYRYFLNADGTAVQPGQQNPVVVSKGDQIGAVTVGELTQIAWMPAGGARARPALLALDRDGFFVQYDPSNGLSVIAARDPSAWGGVNAIVGNAGTLFALSATQKVLARFAPQDTGYDGEAYNYLASTTQVDLSDVTTIAADGSLYLEHASGLIEKLTDGKPADFAVAPRDLMPAHPVGLALGGGSLFVGDPAQGRVVQLTRGGVYQRALSADDGAATLGHLRDLAVSDDGRTLYALTDGGVCRFQIPGPG
jgi:hypothetical protein